MNHVFSRRAFDAVIFDLDGVITGTANLHFAAWKRLFDGFLRQRAAAAGAEFKPFTEEEYRRYVDGKPRHEGVNSFLVSRGILLPPGNPDEPPGLETVNDLGTRKNVFFQEELRRKGPEVFASSIRLIRTLRARNFRIGLVSSSRNLGLVINAAGIGEFFDAKVNGAEIGNLDLPGKPAPDAFLLAAEKLGVQPGRSVVVEDSRAGVEAGRRGGFGLVIGVDRHNDPEGLRRAGADLVVADLGELCMEEDRLLSTASTAALPSALDRFAEIAERLALRRPAVFLDYDGTLTPIVRNPVEAVLSVEIRGLLGRLARRAVVAVISGRDLADIRRMVGLDHLCYAGSHGFDIAGPAGEEFVLEKGAEYLNLLDHAGRELERILSGLAGIRLERKRFALAVHYREAGQETAARLGPIIDGVITRHSGLRTSGGKKIIELRPDIDWDKGRAILWLLERFGLDRAGVLPIYLGDDLTDEDAFRVLRTNGIGIVVRDAPRPTSALYALDDPDQVRTFLEMLTVFLEKAKP